MTALPDWLVERVALDEVSPALKPRVERADARELAARVEALRAENAAELAAYPAAQAAALIDGRIGAEKARVQRQRQLQRLRWFSMVSGVVAAAVVVIVLIGRRGADGVVQPGDETEEVTRAKGPARLLAFRQAGDKAELLDQDAVVKAGDVVQLRYKPVGKNYGVIASLDGAGVVTLHYPAREDAPPEATALAPRTTALPKSYQLDDAPHFERFVFITGDRPIDVQQAIASVKELARRSDSATAPVELPPGLQQWSLRLRKADRQPASTEDRP